MLIAAGVSSAGLHWPRSPCRRRAPLMTQQRIQLRHRQTRLVKAVTICSEQNPGQTEISPLASKSRETANPTLQRGCFSDFDLFFKFLLFFKTLARPESTAFAEFVTFLEWHDTNRSIVKHTSLV
jgi:hypothetical protein